jgi:gamma-glutamyltranspeptidase/glutathione hydrolase
VTEDGIILNDEMDDFGSPGRPNAFGFAPSPANFIAGGKRPLSSISSTIVENEQGQIVMATGSAGGSQIITATVQEVYHYIDQGLNATMCTRQCVP